MQLLILRNPVVHRVRSRLLHINTNSDANLVAPARSPLLRVLIVYHTLLLVLLDTLAPSERLPLRLFLLRNGLLARNLRHGSRERDL